MHVYGCEAKKNELIELERMEGELRKQVETWRLKKDTASCGRTGTRIGGRVGRTGENMVVVIRRMGR